MDRDTQDDFVLVGKNDIAHEFFLYWLKMNSDQKPVVQWQSDNLYEDHSTIWAVSGKFESAEEELLAISNSQYYLYRIENNHVNLIRRGDLTLKPLAVTSGDLDGDGKNELIIAKIGKITSTIYNCTVQIWKFQGERFVELTESDLIGNIRGMTVGTLEKAGPVQLFIEEGPRFAPGNIHVLRYSDQKLDEVYNLKKATKGPAYGMQVQNFSGEMRLVIATAPGFINFYGWANHGLVPLAGEINLKKDLMSLAAADVNQDNNPVLIVAAYPQDLMILSKSASLPMTPAGK